MNATLILTKALLPGCLQWLREIGTLVRQTRTCIESAHTATVASLGCERCKRNPPCVFRHGWVAPLPKGIPRNGIGVTQWYEPIFWPAR